MLKNKDGEVITSDHEAKWSWTRKDLFCFFQQLFVDFLPSLFFMLSLVFFPGCLSCDVIPVVSCVSSLDSCQGRRSDRDIEAETRTVCLSVSTLRL